MVSEQLTVVSEKGIHLICANVLANVADKYNAKVLFKTEYMIINVKSIINVVSASLRKGDVVTCECNGPEEVEALAAMKELMSQDLDEYYVKHQGK